MYIYNIQFLVLMMTALYLFSAFISLVFHKNYKFINMTTNVISSFASIIGIWSSINFLISKSSSILILNLSSIVPYQAIYMKLDKLSAYFILALSILVLSVSIYSTGYISHYYGKRNVGLFYFLYNMFIVSMITVAMSGSTVFFLVAWELMALTSYFLVIFESEKQENQKAGMTYLIMTHVATAFLTIAFALMYKYTGSLDISVNLQAIPANIKNIMFICFLIGFGTKAGIIPFHIWLPLAHPAAPSNVSALMSGIMIKTAIYGLVRFVLMDLNSQFQWWGITILVIGAISTILGVAYALMEHNIKRLLAYHSIENIGIILMGLGISSFAYSNGNMVLASLALLASLFHLLNHTIFKGALFLGAGAIHYSTNTKDIEKLGGLIKKMPLTSVFFLIPALSISAIPPFNGFISEWITYQSLFNVLSSSSSLVKIVAILSVAALAMAGALAATCFVKFFGIAFLGLPRSKASEEAKEVPGSMLWGMGILAALCVIIGIFPQMIMGLIDGINLDIFKYSITTQMQGASFYSYYPINVDRNTISPLLVLITGVILIVITFVTAKFLGLNAKERKHITWDCGYPNLNSRMQYSATGFSKPLRIVLRMFCLTSRKIQIEEGVSPYHPKSIKYTISNEALFEKYLYTPLVKMLIKFARTLRLRIQTGSIHAYLIYIFLTLIALLIYYGMN